ncbi:MAG TPA: alpha-glucosidase C-terminal domain-containing protein, partial [Longimicrobiales bacterium]
RAATRFDDGAHRDQIARALGALQLTLRGTPVMYSGEEIGMTNNDPTRREDVQDPVGRRGWPNNIGRDGERTPMQWSGGANAGFNKGARPWLPLPASAATHNVAAESRDPNSVLGLYRTVLQLRKNDAALREGSYTALDTANAKVMSYLRRQGGDVVLVTINMSEQPQTVSYDLARQGLAGATATPLVTSAASGNLRALTLQPYGVWIARVKAGAKAGR